ncbi:MAG TPA: ribosome maturation factor RimM [Aestuariivirgaceae bacterium]|nr:ribosome maturation factor RimM [Aestuariivirgaceae bacterium]
MAGGRILIGVIGPAHGLKGEVKLKSFAEEPGAIASYGALEVGEEGRKVTITALKPASAGFIARLEGIGDRSAAEALKGAKLYVRRDQLPKLPDGTFYHADLEGLAVRTQDGTTIGEVEAVVNYGAGDLLRVKGAGPEPLLVPFAGASVDLGARTIIVTLAEGLLDNE